MQRLWESIERCLSVKLNKESSRDGYRSRFLEWCRYLGAVWGTDSGALRVLNATGEDVENYIIELRKRKGHPGRTAGSGERLSDATIYAKLVAIQSIYGYLMKKDLLSKNPVIQADYSLATNMNRKRPTLALPYEKVEPLINSFSWEDKTYLRDRAYTSLVFAGGFRRQEVVDIRVGHIRKHENGIFSIYLPGTKSKEDQEQAIAPILNVHLEQYLLQRVAEKATPESFLFSRPCGGKYSYAVLYQRFKLACKRIGINPKHFSPHSARATAITKLLDDGLSHREVKDFSRHKSVAMVEVYDKRIKNVQNSPAIKLKYST